MAKVRFRPPPVEETTELVWLLRAAFSEEFPEPLESGREEATLILARRLGLSAPIGARLRDPANTVQLPAGLTGPFRRALAQSAIRAAMHERTARQIAQTAAHLSVPIVFLKGFALFLSGRDRGGGRTIGDLDLLAPEAGAKALHAELRREGFETAAESGNEHHLATLAAPEAGTIDLHFCLRGLAFSGSTWANWTDLHERGALLPAEGFPVGCTLPDIGVQTAHLLAHGLAHHVWRPHTYPLLVLIGDLRELLPDSEAWREFLGHFRETLLRSIHEPELAAIRQLSLGLRDGRVPALSAQKTDADGILLRHILGSYLDPGYGPRLRSRHSTGRLVDAARQGRLGHYLARRLRAEPVDLAEMLDRPNSKLGQPTSKPPPFWSKHLRREVQFLLDLGILTLAFFAAYLFRFDFRIPRQQLLDASVQVPFVVLVQFACLLIIGVYNFVWRYIGMAEIQVFLRAAVYSGLPFVLLRLGLPNSLDAWKIPLSVILMDTIFAFGGVLGIRVLRRALYERHERHRGERSTKGHRPKKVILVGAGRAGALAVREIRGRGDLDLELAGFVDDAEEKQGSVIAGLSVLGTTQDVAGLIAEHSIDQVIITMTDAPAATIRRIVSTCDRAGTRVRIIPGYYEILNENVSISRFRDVQIEDLLGREPVELDEARIRSLLTGRSVLVTGAGGSIGSELARQVARFNPLRVTLLDRSEPSLFIIDRDLRELYPTLDIRAHVTDIGDASAMHAVLDKVRPQVIFHAAAHKHVPMMETNVCEAVKNNILGTEILGRVAGEARCEVFVLISTDKAVRPSSIMGATKRVAELVIQDLDRQFADTRFLAVRFGNVLGSTGSVVPIFRRQIEKGGPVTVTHPDATRYFMTPSEAAQLVMEAGAIGSGGEILILDMGDPVRILDLARDMITLSSYKPYDDIEIAFTGLRPGEKLAEQLQLDSEQTDRTVHPKVFVGKLSHYPSDQVQEAFGALRELVAKGSTEAIRRHLADFLPEAQLQLILTADEFAPKAETHVVH